MKFNFAAEDITDILKRQLVAQFMSKIIAGDGMTITVGGINYEIIGFLNGRLRDLTKNNALVTQTKQMDAYGLDLVWVNLHAGCSDLCINSQGEIYSEFGKTKGYPLLSDHVWDGKTGLFHKHCYHTKNVYIKGVSETLRMADYRENYVTKDENAEIRAKNEDMRYNERVIRRKRRELALKSNSIPDYRNSDEYKRKVSNLEEWKKRPHDEYRAGNYYKFGE